MHDSWYMGATSLVSTACAASQLEEHCCFCVCARCAGGTGLISRQHVSYTLMDACHGIHYKHVPVHNAKHTAAAGCPG